MAYHQNADGSGTEGTKIEPNGQFVSQVLGITISSAVGIGCAVDDEWARLESFPPGYLKAKHDAKVREGVALA